MSKMTWDNPVLISPAMAQRMGLQNKDVVELELDGRKVEAAVWIQAGHPDNSVTAFLATDAAAPAEPEPALGLTCTRFAQVQLPGLRMA